MESVKEDLNALVQDIDSAKSDIDDVKSTLDETIDWSRRTVEEGQAIARRQTEAMEAIALNTEYIAMGIAKIVERCFCGERLDEHEGGGKCSSSKCACEAFMPMHLAIARLLNSVAAESVTLNEQLGSFLELVSAFAGNPGGPTGIVKPF